MDFSEIVDEEMQTDIEAQLLYFLSHCIREQERIMAVYGEAELSSFFWIMHKGYWNMIQANFGPMDDFLGHNVKTDTSIAELPRLWHRPSRKPNSRNLSSLAANLISSLNPACLVYPEAP